MGKVCYAPRGGELYPLSLKELENHGYLTRQRTRYENGRLGDITYTIHEKPVEKKLEGEPPEPEKPERENPRQVNPKQAEPGQENHAQLNTEQSNTDGSNVTRHFIVDGKSILFSTV